MKYKARVSGWRMMIWLLLLWLCAALPTLAQTATQPQKASEPATPAKALTPVPAPEKLTAAEFARLSRELSEPGGSFRSDNFTSNETSYLHIVQKMRELGATGGVYIGVGPEQNYTYIAKVRPRLAFLIDIRRQAIIQHLMYKAIFHLSPTRGEFLARLLSKPLPKEKPPTAAAPLNELLALFEKLPTDDKAYEANLELIRKTIEQDFEFTLSEADQKSLAYVYQNFHDDGLGISYRVESQWGSSYFPTLKEILAGTDLKGQQGNFLATTDDYEFVREMHRKNLIIPVVGNFAGPKALGAIGDYLRKHSLTVTAFYLSNVEQYLFMDGIFGDWANNVRKLPLTEKSLFIRAIAGRGPHPARINGHRLTTLLQRMTVFLKDFDEGLYPSYNDLTLTHYIAADQP